MAENALIAGPHLVRYGIAADQKYLIGEFLDTYDQLVINATIAAYQASALANFITQRAQNKPYFIDPQTHAFQHDVEHLQSTSKKSAGKIKKSVQKLLDSYGEPIKTQIENYQSILPDDFKDATIRKAFCERVLSYQMKIMANEAEQSDAAPYYAFLKEEDGTDFNVGEPNLLVAPYFYMDGATLEEWLPMNLVCAMDSKPIAKKMKLPLAVQVVISSGVLFDADQMGKLIEGYVKIKPDIFLIWVDEFDEQSASVSALRGFADMVKKLGTGEVPVVNLYGGYFSVLLLHCGVLNGVTHSLEYGERRAVVPVGGGIPVAKYYLPDLHYRMQTRDALRAVRKLVESDGTANGFHKNVCDCEQCKKVITGKAEIDFMEQYGKTKIIKGRAYPTAETKKNSVRHYMWRKQREFKEEYEADSIIQELRETHEKLRRAVGVENAIHCKNWADVLEEIDK